MKWFSAVERKLIRKTERLGHCTVREPYYRSEGTGANGDHII